MLRCCVYVFWNVSETSQSHWIIASLASLTKVSWFHFDTHTCIEKSLRLCMIVFFSFISLLFLAILNIVFSYNLLWLLYAHVISNHLLNPSTLIYTHTAWIGATCEQNGENDGVYFISVSLITCPFTIRNNWLTP